MGPLSPVPGLNGKVQSFTLGVQCVCKRTCGQVGLSVLDTLLLFSVAVSQTEVSPSTAAPCRETHTRTQLFTSVSSLNEASDTDADSSSSYHASSYTYNCTQCYSNTLISAEEDKDKDGEEKLLFIC